MDLAEKILYHFKYKKLNERVKILYKEYINVCEPKLIRFFSSKGFELIETKTRLRPEPLFLEFTFKKDFRFIRCYINFEVIKEDISLDPSITYVETGILGKNNKFTSWVGVLYSPNDMINYLKEDITKYKSNAEFFIRKTIELLEFKLNNDSYAEYFLTSKDEKNQQYCPPGYVPRKKLSVKDTIHVYLMVLCFVIIVIIGFIIDIILMW